MMQNSTAIPRYWRRSTTSFTREEYEQIINTPPADHAALHAESERILREFRKAQEEKNAAIEN